MTVMTMPEQDAEPNAEQDAEPKAKSATTPPEIAFTQEIRFAVVMYGGVSLAIYINGVAQELLKLVRATAPRPDGEDSYAQHNDDDLYGSERVYRKLGRMLVYGKRAPVAADPSSPIRTRFVVDVLSGTSAGGINAIYLAKALANDQKIGELKALWIKEGHIGALINDELSLATTRLPTRPPRSLLNSQRMYWKLVDAIEDMDDQPGDRNGDRSPNVDELDLYVTATDTQGQIVPIKLADGVAEERRHRSVFHFRYSNACYDEHQHPGKLVHNDFKRENNLFLAFAARCTSAFPVAFEPMSLRAISEVIRLHRRFAGQRVDLNQEGWRPFYAQYSQDDDFLDRYFSDGGVLDNYPFSYASGALPSRSATRPVDRKLLYIEPAPENPFDTEHPAKQPDFLANAWLSLSALPRYETIRQDLQEVLQRNRLIERVRRIIDGMERDLLSDYSSAKPNASYWQTSSNGKVVSGSGTATVPPEPKTNSGPELHKELQGRANTSQDTPQSAQNTSHAVDLESMVKRKGLAWIGYQRLRAAQTTDELAHLIARAKGFDEESASFQAIRRIVRQWRDEKYKKLKTDGESIEMQTLYTFVFDFDLEWRLRRLKFVFAKIDTLISFDWLGEEPQPDELPQWKVFKHFGETDLFAEADDLEAKRAKADGFRKELRRIKADLNRAYTLLRRCRGYLRGGNLDRPLVSVIRGLHSELDLESDPVKVAKLKADIINATRDRGQLRVDIATRSWATLEQAQKSQLKLGTLIDAIDLCREQPGEPGRRSDHPCEPLTELLEAHDERAQQDVITKYAESWLKPIEELAQQITALYMLVLDKARQLCEDSLRTKRAADESKPEQAEERASTDDALATPAEKIIWHYFNNFEDFDMTVYPLVYATQVGDELDPVEIYRISPQDAPSLDTHKTGTQKLAGNQISNFGAFFKETFRTNDILWGQLDGAERIITALLPNKDQEPLRKELIEEAHCAILAEEVFAKDFGYREERQIRQFVEEATADIEQGVTAQRQLELAEKFNAILAASPLSDKTWPLRTYLEGRNPVDEFRDHYHTDRTLDPVETVRFAARASKVFGKMLEGHALAQRLSGNRMVWITRLAQLFWALVEVIVPDSVPNLIFHHWLKLLYFFELLMVVLGTLFVNQPIQQFGFIAFVVTVITHGAVLFLGDQLAPRLAQPPPGAARPAQATRAASAAATDTALGAKLAQSASRVKYLTITVVAITSALGLMVLMTAFGAISFRPFIEQLVRPLDSPNLTQQIIRGGALLIVICTFVLASAADFGPYLRQAGARAGGGWFAAAKWLLRLLAPLLGLALLATTLGEALFGQYDLPGGFRTHVIALELAQDTGQLGQVISSYANVQDIYAGLTLDTWAFIPLYLLLFIALAYVLVRGDTKYGKPLGLLLGAGAVGAGLTDLIENLRIRAAVAAFNLTEAGDPQLVATMHAAALAKWWVFAALMALLGLAFLLRRGWARALGMFYVVIAVVGVLGLTIEPPLIELFFGLIGAALILSGEAAWRIRRPAPAPPAA